MVNQKEHLQRVLEPYTHRPAELIQALHKVQSALGYVPRWAQVQVAEVLGVPPAQVRGVITFYHLFRQQPVGKHTVRVCMGTACHVRGAQRVLQAVEEETKAPAGKTSPDGAFTVEVVRCLGACGLAPVMMVDDEVSGRLDPRKARKVIQEVGRGT